MNTTSPVFNEPMSETAQESSDEPPEPLPFFYSRLETNAENKPISHLFIHEFPVSKPSRNEKLIIIATRYMRCGLTHSPPYSFLSGHVASHLTDLTKSKHLSITETTNNSYCLS